MKTLAERLQFALDKSGKKKTDIWKGCGLSSGAISHWFNNPKTEIKGKNLLCASRILGVRPEWLATGIGDPDITESERLMNQISEAMYSLKEDDLKHVSDLCVILLKKSGINHDEIDVDHPLPKSIQSKPKKLGDPNRYRENRHSPIKKQIERRIQQVTVIHDRRKKPWNYEDKGDD